ncbi:hypothetical protein ACSRUE_19330 [Sorangium sp. KYC3313]|uniref:hypothetical protein n=1 Tax=Sorangium sp. KYC3313 TaxID=3449740 RepID=UPI003F8BBFE8
MGVGDLGAGTVHMVGLAPEGGAAGVGGTGAPRVPSFPSSASSPPSRWTPARGAAVYVQLAIPSA